MSMKFKYSSVTQSFPIFAMILSCPLVYVFAQQDTAVAARRIVDRASSVHGSKLADGSIVDWVGRGQVKITGDENGPLRFVLVVKGKDRIQRVIETHGGAMLRYGSDGKKSWQSSGSFSGAAVGRAAQLIESQTTRSVSRLFESNAKGKSFRDMGSEKKDFIPQSVSSHAIEAEDEKGNITRYYVDNESSLVTRLEFETGEYYRLPFGDEEYPMMAAYVFSDYRPVDDVMTPFKIEVYQGLVKIEEMTFDSIQFNTGVTDDAFVP
jgi:outer membrane lipoprotein-sorting protein